MEFIINIEEHQPANKGKPCLECVLAAGMMCLDRSYCRFPKTGKTWKKCLQPPNLENSTEASVQERLYCSKCDSMLCNRKDHLEFRLR